MGINFKTFYPLEKGSGKPYWVSDYDDNSSTIKEVYPSYGDLHPIIGTYSKTKEDDDSINEYTISIFFKDKFGRNRICYTKAIAPDIDSLYDLWKLMEQLGAEPLSPTPFENIPSRPYPKQKDKLLVVTGVRKVYSRKGAFINYVEKTKNKLLSNISSWRSIEAEAEMRKALNGGRQYPKDKFSLYWFIRNNAFAFALINLILCIVAIIVFAGWFHDYIYIFVPIIFGTLIFSGVCVAWCNVRD